MLTEMPGWVLYIFAGLIGAVLGSFANVCIWRMPRGESVVWPGSHCPSCGHKLAFWENVPILSYIFLFGRCRHCRGRISLQYPIVELLCCALSLLAWWHFQEPLRFFIYLCLFIVPLVIVSGIDLGHMIIPDSISIPGIAIGVLVHVFVEGRASYLGAAIDSAIGIIVGGGSLYLVAIAYEKLKKQEGLGGGDVKLIAMLGAFFGWRASILILLMSSFLGSLVGLALIVAMRKDMKYAIPFGPFLAVAGIFYLFAGMPMIRWYLGFFH
ncbi:MAG: prepilin peptidase [bacterium]